MMDGTLTMQVERVHPLSSIRTFRNLHRLWAVIGMKLLVAFAVLIPSKPLTTPRPFALERLFFAV